MNQHRIHMKALMMMAIAALTLASVHAGGLGGSYKVWLLQHAHGTGNVLLEGNESRSRQGNAVEK